MVLQSCLYCMQKYPNLQELYTSFLCPLRRWRQLEAPHLPSGRPRLPLHPKLGGSLHGHRPPAALLEEPHHPDHLHK